MSRQAENGLQTVLDGLAFASEGAVVAGFVALAALPRLAEVLADDAGRLDCRVTGSRDCDGRCWLALDVSGTLGLVCQRCLKKLVFPVGIQTRLLLVPPGQAWPDEELAEDGFDAVAAEKEMALLSLIEDEVLLALPIAPMHETCATPMPVVEEHEPSPFAVLAKLKKGV
jgi:uncharacterized protein